MKSTLIFYGFLFFSPVPRSIDVGFPIACDDEYWYTENPEDAFVQPPDKPSVLAFFHSYLDLNQILAFCMRTTVSQD